MSSNPIPNTIKLIHNDPLCNAVKDEILSGKLIDNSSDPHQHFIKLFDDWVSRHDHFTLNGIDDFKHKDVIIGCHHYLDGLLIKHGIDSLQVLEHDYRYYQRLCPNKKWAVPGELIPDQPLVIATPMPGFLGPHPKLKYILDEAVEKNIDVHLDGAWLSCSKGIKLDLSKSCIKSIGISLSKGYSASWNRIGVRYSRDVDKNDPITIYNGIPGSMCPESVLRNGILLLENIPSGHLWNTYEDKYMQIVKKNKFFRTNILFAAYDNTRTIQSVGQMLVE
jgi:hypothetical protein